MEKLLINRLGFDAWADNKFVNAIEDYSLCADGVISMEREDFNMKLTISEKMFSCVIRAYTQDGWQTYEKECKR